MQDKTLWEACLLHFEESLPAQQYNSWIKPLNCIIVDDCLTLIAPNTFILKVIQDRFLNEIKEISKQLSFKITHFDIKIDKLSIPTVKAQNINIPTNKINLIEKITLPTQVVARNHSKLNGALAFESFVTGKANQLAHAAAMQVANFPGTVYNPLFIYGGVGLGKTHLLQSIGNLIKKENPQAKICYVHATNYISDVVRAFQTKKFDEFKQFYNSLDLLLIDDIQFIADKPGTQQEFFYTLNSLIDTNKQVVITCDTFPKEINGIEARLTSRFSCGLTVAVEPPGLEMRVAILLQKAVAMNHPIKEDVAFFIAKHVRSNIRELEGALNRILAYAKFHKEIITVESAKEALKDLLSAQNKQVSVENIQKTVAEFYRLKVIELLSKKRTRAIARPRQIAMCLARELTQLSLPDIGNAFGGRDHSTVLHACKTIESLRNTDQALNTDFNLLNQTLRN
jgi:chromosomal replication initiator protein